MMRFLKSAILLALLLILATNMFAQHYSYAPNSIYFCQLQKKYAATLSGSLSRGNAFSGRELQAAFSPIKHGAILINYLDAQRNAVRRQEDEGTSSRFAEIGIGAYETTNLGTVSIFAGFGKGSIFSNYMLNRVASFDLERWFIQPSILRRSKNFEWGVALRFNRLIYSNGSVDYSIDDYDLRAVRALEERSPFFIPELGLHAGLSFSLFTFSVNLTNVFYAANTYNFERINSSLMLTFDVGNVGKKKKDGEKK